MANQLYKLECDNLMSKIQIEKSIKTHSFRYRDLAQIKIDKI